MIVSEVVRADSAKRSPHGLTSPGEIHNLQFSDSGMKKIRNHPGEKTAWGCHLQVHGWLRENC